MKISNGLGDLIISYNPIKLEEWEEYCIEIYDKFEKLGYKIPDCESYGEGEDFECLYRREDFCECEDCVCFKRGGLKDPRTNKKIRGYKILNKLLKEHK